MREPEYVVQRDVSLRPFDGSNVSAVQSTRVRKRFLAEAQRLTQSAHVSGDNPAQRYLSWPDSHAADGRAAPRHSLQTISSYSRAKQFEGLDFKRNAQLCDGAYTDVLFGPLYCADLRPMEISRFAQDFLTPSPGLAEATDVGGEKTPQPPALVASTHPESVPG